MTMTSSSYPYQNLCQAISAELMAHEDMVAAALQAAGPERKLEGKIQCGMEKWLSQKSLDLICLTEYLKVDFSFIERNSIGCNLLNVRSMFEVKFNYTSQLSELLNRPRKAVQQLNSYKKKLPKADAYLLYMLADHSDRSVAKIDYDRGWRYLGKTTPNRFENGIEQMRQSAATAGLNLLDSNYSNIGNWNINLSLFCLRCNSGEFSETSVLNSRP